ncbi:MAG: restriction endonuclease subunit S [Lachnospiraceae bacterium]
MSDNKKPAIRFNGFTDDWEQRKLGELTLESSEYATLSSKLPLLTSSRSGLMYQNEYRGNLTTESEKTIFSVVPFGTCTYRHMSDDDIFHLNINTLEKGLVSREYPVFMASEDNVLEFIVQYINSSSKFRAFCAEQKKGGTRTRLYYKTLCEFSFMVTKSKEQQRIAEFFTDLDHLITLHQRKCERLQTIKKAMLEKMFPQNGSKVPEIRFAGFTDDWEQRKLGELGTITTGSTPSTSIPDYYSDDGIVWVTPTDICENITFESARKLSDLGQQVGRVVPKNTILVTCIASIGKNTMLGNTGSFNQQINGLTPNENECDPYFLLTESALWSAKMKSSAAAGTMQIVNRTEFSELKTWLPSLIEQQAISNFFRQLDNLITLHQRQLEKLQNIKKSMLEKMFV